MTMTQTTLFGGTSKHVAGIPVETGEPSKRRIRVNHPTSKIDWTKIDSSKKVWKRDILAQATAKMHRTRINYFAYGSNLDATRMLKRCPSAKCLGPVAIMDYELTFREVANMEAKKDGVIYGVVYSITQADELVLDWCEGVPFSYEKKYVQTRYGKTLFYGMNPESHRFEGEPEEPTLKYFEYLAVGHIEYDLPIEPLMEALMNVMDDEYVLQYYRALVEDDVEIVEPQPVKRSYDCPTAQYNWLPKTANAA